MFGKKEKSRDEIISEAAQVDEVEEEKKKDEVSTGNAKLDMEITKIKGQLDALNEVRKANSDRFSRMSEQMGEIRGMITDLNKTISKIEVGATKAIDLVDSVQPEKLMVQVRKQDAKVEATKAQLESTEARMKDMLYQIKGMREKMDVYKGLEQVAEMNEEMKDELAEMRRMQVNIEKHADRVETMFLEVNKKFVEFDKFNDVVKDMKRQFDKMVNDMEKFKIKLDDKAEKKEFVNLIDRFNDFQKHTDNVLKLLDERSKGVKENLFSEFNKVKDVLEHKYDVDFAKAEEQMEIREEKGIISKVKEKVTGKGEEKAEEKAEKHKIVDKELEDGESPAQPEEKQEAKPEEKTKASEGEKPAAAESDEKAAET